MNRHWPILCCLALSLAASFMQFGPSIVHPSEVLFGGWDHPDSLSNHWLLVWMSQQIGAFDSLFHNSKYYVPVGDAPWLAGNGSEGFLFAPFYWALGWPMAVPAYMVTLWVLIGLSIHAFTKELGLSGWATLVIVVHVLLSPYLSRELSAARFSQGDILWICLGLCFLFRLLNKPTRTNSLLLGLSVSIMALMYWYYAWFFGLMALIFMVCWWIQKRDLPWRYLGYTFLVTTVTISPLVWIFARHWTEIPGTLETIFPSPEAKNDSLISFPVEIRATGMMSVAAVPLASILYAGVGLFSLRKSQTPWMVWGAMLIILLFGLLAMGVNTPLFDWVYGGLSPLKRFWWPSRHVLGVTIGLGIICAVGVQSVLDRFKATWHPTLGLVSALILPLCLWAQNDLEPVVTTPLNMPPTPYEQLHKLPPGGVIQLPIQPKLSSSQSALFYQLFHHRPMLNGHAQWVDRVRPKEWDSAVSSNILLASIQSYSSPDSIRRLECSSSAIEELSGWGIRYIILDPSFYPRAMSSLLIGLEEGLNQMFGDPVLRLESVLVWDVLAWNSLVSVDVSHWEWPSTLKPSDGSHAIHTPMNINPMLSPKDQ